MKHMGAALPIKRICPIAVQISNSLHYSLYPIVGPNKYLSPKHNDLITHMVTVVKLHTLALEDSGTPLHPGMDQQDCYFPGYLGTLVSLVQHLYQKAPCLLCPFVYELKGSG